MSQGCMQKRINDAKTDFQCSNGLLRPIPTSTSMGALMTHNLIYNQLNTNIN